MTEPVDIRLSAEQLRQLARLGADETRRHGQPVDRLPEDTPPDQNCNDASRLKAARTIFPKPHVSR